MATQFAVDLVFKTQGDQNVRKVANELQGLDRKARSAQGGLDGASNGIKRTGRAAASATANVQRFGIAFRSVLGPLVAVTGAITFFSRSLNTLGERQADVAALANGLKGLTTNGNAALESLLASADKLGKQTLFNDEDFRKSFKLLTSFRTIGVSTYERVATVGADMAQVLGQDVNSVLLQVAKALEAPEVGLTALQRSGTRFTDQQKEQVKAMVAAGQTAQAQAFILSELERQYGGAAKAAGSAGFAGAMDSLGESFRDFQETIGRVIEPLATGFVKALTASIEWMNAGYQAVLKLMKAFAPLGELLDSLGINWENFGKAAELAGKVVSVVANDVAYIINQMAKTVAEVLGGLFKGIGQFFSGIVDSSAQGMKGVVDNVVKGIRAIRNAIASLINSTPPAMLSKLLGFDVGKTLTTPIGGIASGIEGAFNYGSSVLQRAQSLNFGGGGGYKDILSTGTPDPTQSGGGGGKGKGKGKSEREKQLEKEAALAKRMEEQYNRLTQSVIDGNVSYAERLNTQQRLNALLLEGFTPEKAQEQVSFETEINRLQRDRAKKIEELRGIEGITQDKIKTGELAINQAFDQRIQSLFQEKQLKGEILERTEAQKKAEEELNAQRQIGADALNAAGTQITGMLDTLIQGTDDWNKVLQNTLKSLSSMLLKFGIKALAGTDGEGLFSFLDGSLKGFASGGRPPVGKASIVGERGPELFVPGRSGTIIPNDELGGGGGTVVNITLNGVGGGSSTGAGPNKEEAARLARMVEAATVGVIQRERRPGGLLAR